MRGATFLCTAVTIMCVAEAQQPELPPVSWTCPMHPDVVEPKKGACPICRMDLVPVRLVSIWTCPIHSIVHEAHEGRCPICRRDLVQVTVAVVWTCPDRPNVEHSSPSKCPDGSDASARYISRPHGNHNPQHGGLFFMAPDNWHHLEGTYPRAGVFRLRVYDDYSRPLAADRLTQVAGRVVTKETVDPATHTTREERAYPLKISGGALEAPIDPLTPPAQMTAKVTFTRGGPEYRFDFVFPEFSREPDGPVVPSGVDPGLRPIEVPDDPSNIVTLLAERSRAVGELVQRGAFAEIYGPAFQAKDLAVALELHVSDLPAPRRAAAADAILRVVRAAWQLDAAGDVGDRDQIEKVYDLFSRAVRDLRSAFPAKPRGPRGPA